jgi:hypothetical protein
MLVRCMDPAYLRVNSMVKNHIPSTQEVSMLWLPTSQHIMSGKGPISREGGMHLVAMNLGRLYDSPRHKIQLI